MSLPGTDTPKDGQGIDDLRLWLAMLENIVGNSSNMVVITDARRRITWINAAYSQTTGWTLDDCVGRRPGDLLHGPATDAAEVARIGARTRQGLSVSGVELLNYKKSGEPYWTSLSIEPMRNPAGEIVAYLSIQSDITERRRMAQEASELRHRLEEAQRLARLGRIERDATTNQLSCSREICRILNLPDDSPPRTYAALWMHVHADEASALREAWGRSQATGQELDHELRVVGAGGRERWVRCRGEPHPEQGGFGLPLVLSVQDITAYKERLAERARHNDELNSQVLVRTRALEESNRALEEFSYALSHDLRAPLRHMASFAELLREELPGTSAAHLVPYCDRIVQGSQRMKQLIDGMLSFARLGPEGIQRQRVDVDAQVHEVVAQMDATHPHRRVRWRVQPGLPPVTGDAVLLREVWINLLDNALKYSADRDVSDIEVGWQQHLDGVVYVVRDNGVGFDPQKADKLFGMFQRLHHERRFEGAGIGLALTRRIVESHGGRIWATSQPGQGAAFHVFLSARPAEDGVAPVERAAAA
ncbi:MAG: PAS domain S-box protein [Hydrogenophaga sp.]|jgi:PAS domain S-box-containing protein|nr:PAS domain S-box protein [Hydrogenophaga sp.]